MNSYSIGISSSWIIAITSILIAFILVFFYYRRTNPSLTLSRKILLISLRTLALSLLLFIIFEPVFTIVSGQFVKPKTAILLDWSKSMELQDAGGERKQNYEKILEKLRQWDIESDSEIILFNQSYRKVEGLHEIDTINFGEGTDISKVIDRVKYISLDENISSVVLVTDGAFNMGENPIYKAESLGKPIFTIGVGDTTEPKDVSINSIYLKESVNINSLVPINVTIKSSGFKDSLLTIKLFDNDKFVTSKEIQLENDISEQSIYFEYNADKEGTHKITVEADSKLNEISTKNNKITDYLEVSKKKTRITLLSGSPSPDLSFMNQVLNDDKSIELKSFIQKYKSEYYSDPPQLSDFINSDIIILMGYPNRYTSESDMKMIAGSLEEQKSLWFIASKDIDYTKLKILSSYLPFNVLASNIREYSSISSFTQAASSHPLFRTNSETVNLEDWNKLPPLIRTETFVKADSEAEVLAKVKVNNVVLNEPLIISKSTSRNRILAVLAYDLYKWKLLGYAQDKYRNSGLAQDLYSAFIKNSIQWLSTDTEKKKFKIKSLKKNYLLTENPQFVAEVYDASMNPIDNSIVNIKVTDGKNENEIQLYPSVNGIYTGYTEGLPLGDYYFNGSAKLNGKLIGKDAGRFSISDISREYLDLKMNIGLLRTISNITGGKFYLNSDIDQLQKELETNNNNKTKSITTNSEFPLWNLPIILIVVIFLFGLEWFIRKRLGLL